MLIYKVDPEYLLSSRSDDANIFVSRLTLTDRIEFAFNLIDRHFIFAATSHPCHATIFSVDQSLDFWLTPGAVLFVPSGERLTITFEKTTGIAVTIASRFVDLVAPVEPGTRNRLHMAINVEGTHVTCLMPMLLQSFERRGPLDDAMLRLLSESLATTLRAVFSTSGKIGFSPAGGLQPFKINKLVKYIDDNLPNKLALDELADVVDMSAGHFARAFKKSLNVTPHRYIQQQRVARALAMIEQTGCSKSDAAKRCGLGGSSQLLRAWRGVMLENTGLGVVPPSFIKSRRTA